MKICDEEQLYTLLSIKSTSELFSEITRLAHDLGFEHIGYGLRAPIPISQPKVEIFNNYPSAWQAKYVEQNLVEIDPTVLHGASSILPVIWTDELFTDTRDFWEEARSYGLCHGWAQSSRDSNGMAGMLTLARATDELSNIELEIKTQRMVWLTQTIHICMSNLLTKTMLPESDVNLTGREKSILQWTAEGKTSGEIGMILNITERTVNFHINNTMLKLNASNKTAAAVRAAMLGMLQ